MKSKSAIALVALLFYIISNSWAKENKLLVYRYSDSGEGIFEYRQDASTVYVWNKTISKKGEKALFSGLITEDTVVHVIDQTPEPKEILHVELKKYSGKRVAAFAKFYKVTTTEGEIRLLRIDRLLVVILPEKGDS